MNMFAKNDAKTVKEYLSQIPDKLRTHGAKRILDLGCGSGWLSIYLARNGFNVTGIDIAEHAVKLAPQSAEAHYQLGQLALQQNGLHDAERELLISLQLEPSQSKAHFALSVLYRRMKRTDDATKQFAIYQESKEAEESAKRKTIAGGEKP